MNGYIHPIHQFPIDQNQQKVKRRSSSEAQQLFADTLKNAIEHVNKSQKIADEKSVALAKDDIEHLHNVMITAQKASITLETAVQIQRKVIDAYNEVMRMQI